MDAFSVNEDDDGNLKFEDLKLVAAVNEVVEPVPYYRHIHRSSIN